MDDQDLKHLPPTKSYIFIKFWKSTKFFFKIRKLLFYNVYKEKILTIEIEDGREANCKTLQYFLIYRNIRDNVRLHSIYRLSLYYNWGNWNLVIKMEQLMMNDAKKPHQKLKPEIQENIPQIKTLYFWSFVFNG